LDCAVETNYQILALVAEHDCLHETNRRTYMEEIETHGVPLEINDVLQGVGESTVLLDLYLLEQVHKGPQVTRVDGQLDEHLKFVTLQEVQVLVSLPPENTSESSSVRIAPRTLQGSIRSNF
jgi:hypothetical protein